MQISLSANLQNGFAFLRSRAGAHIRPNMGPYHAGLSSNLEHSTQIIRANLEIGSFCYLILGCSYWYDIEKVPEKPIRNPLLSFYVTSRNRPSVALRAF